MFFFSCLDFNRWLNNSCQEEQKDLSGGGGEKKVYLNKKKWLVCVVSAVFMHVLTTDTFISDL